MEDMSKSRIEAIYSRVCQNILRIRSWEPGRFSLNPE